MLVLLKFKKTKISSKLFLLLTEARQPLGSTSARRIPLSSRPWATSSASSSIQPPPQNQAQPIKTAATATATSSVTSTTSQPKELFDWLHTPPGFRAARSLYTRLCDGHDNDGADELVVASTVRHVSSLADPAVLDVLDFFDKQNGGRVLFQELHTMMALLVAAAEDRVEDFVGLHGAALFAAACRAEDTSGGGLYPPRNANPHLDAKKPDAAKKPEEKRDVGGAQAFLAGHILGVPEVFLARKFSTAAQSRFSEADFVELLRAMVRAWAERQRVPGSPGLLVSDIFRLESPRERGAHSDEEARGESATMSAKKKGKRRDMAPSAGGRPNRSCSIL